MTLLDEVRVNFEKYRIEMFASPQTFEWALIQMKAGKKVRRASHPEELYWAIFNDEICTFQRGNGAAWLSGVSITDEDARATDWTSHEEGEGCF